MNIPMKLVYHYMVIFFIHYKSRIATAIVVDEDDNDEFRPERFKIFSQSSLPCITNIACIIYYYIFQLYRY